jgi:hypothetical protein
VANAKTKEIRDVFSAVLRDIDPTNVNDEALWRFVKHFITLEFDVMGEGAHHVHDNVERLRAALQPDQANRALDLWHHLVQIAKGLGDAGGSIDRSGLVSRLTDFKLAPASSVRSDLLRMKVMSDSALADIRMDIGGVRVPRLTAVDLVFDALGEHRFVQIRGEAGAGKSAVLRELAESTKIDGFTFVVSAKRMEGKSWTTFAVANGLSTTSASALLLEIAASSSPTLFIDGIDRIIDKGAQQVLCDLLRPIIEDPACSNWRVVATARDENTEYLRTWLPAPFLAAMTSVEVRAFDNAEATFVAQRHPALKPLLFGDDALRIVSRRPFFLDVLASQVGSTATDSPPRSEVELINLWWARGGYDATHAKAIARQQMLRTFAERGIINFGRSLDIGGLDADVLQSMIDDRVVRPLQPGFTVSFAHDIFFEWALYQTTRAQSDAWIDFIRKAGEPPFFGRVVTLLSQRAFEQQDHWAETLDKLEKTEARSQWKRAWLIGPLGSPLFTMLQVTFDAALAHNTDRMRRLILAFQSEKTQPNPLVLAGFVKPDGDRLATFRLADQLAWPTDYAAWRRFLTWFLPQCATLPESLFAHAIAALSVWMNGLMQRPDLIIPEIGQTLLNWLIRVEKYQHPNDIKEILTRDHSKGLGAIDSDEVRALEHSLRYQFVISTRGNAVLQQSYLQHLLATDRIRGEALSDIFKQTSLIAPAALPGVVDISLAEMRDQLPKEKLKAERGNRFGSSKIDHFDWQALALDRANYSFHPPSPSREPFATLFAHAPTEALRLVNGLSTHAMEAWRQLNQVDRSAKRTPIPIKITFPWGEQEFWGDNRVYYYFRGGFAPDVLATGLMALEQWAYASVENGRPVDDVLKDILSQNPCCAVLGIAVALALEKQHVSPVTLALLQSSRLWDHDIERGKADLLSADQNELGFRMFGADATHHKALVQLNKRTARQHDIRELASLAILSTNTALSEQGKAAIKALPYALPFDFEEQKANIALTAELHQDAQSWARFADPSHYRLWKTDDPTKIAITYENPEAKKPEVIARAQEAAETLSWVSLATWSDKALKSGIDQTSPISLAQAITYAKAADITTLFKAEEDAKELIELKRAAVAGIAGVAIQEATDTNHPDVLWAIDVLRATAQVPTSLDDRTYHGSIIANHGNIAAVRGLKRLILKGLEADWAKERLLAHMLHPLDAIFEAAAANGLQCWEIDPQFAWTALRLSISLSFQTKRRDDWKNRPDLVKRFEQERSEKFANALAELRATPFAYLLPETPNPIDTDEEGHSDDFADDDEEEQTSPLDILFRSDLALRVLPHIPVEAFVAQSADRKAQLIEFADKLLTWTISRHTRQGDNRRSTPPFEWSHAFMPWLARLAVALPSDETLQGLVKRLLQLPDKECFELLPVFVDRYICMAVHDANVLHPDALKQLKEIATRVSSANWTYDSGKVDGSLAREKHELLKALLFVNVDKAPGAARFANGNWKDLPEVLAIVEEVLKGAGVATGALGHYLVLCERAIDRYPADRLCDTLLNLLETQKEKPAALHSISAPERIAAVVQAVATREQPLTEALRAKLLKLLDLLVELGDRRSSALLSSEWFRTTRRS